jgi:hypothetical protein
MSYVALVSVPTKDEVSTLRRDKNRVPRTYNYTVERLIIALAILIASSVSWFQLVPTWIAGPLFALVLFSVLFLIYESRNYGKIMASTAVDVDDYMHTTPDIFDRISVSLSHRFSSGSIRKSKPMDLCTIPSPFMRDLMVTAPLRNETDTALKIDLDTPCIVIGSIRMGFGHHRIARAASSWGVGLKLNTYFHDLLSLESPESQLIHNMDRMYSAGSRLATEIGGPVEAMWGRATLSGGGYSLRQSWLMGEALTAIMETIPRDVPVVCSHSLVGMVAVAAGFKHVVNCVIDNHAQWFCVVPGAVNVVQGPSNYAALLKMGIPPSEVRLVGGWVPKDLVDNIEVDTAARIDRARKSAPRRLLMPIGGAGAQKKYVSALVKAMVPLIKSGSVELFLNAGDRIKNHETFDKLLRELDLSYQLVDDFNVLKEMIATPDTIRTPVVLLAFKEYFPALACTDMLMRICDILVVKPSELAFYPIPKLMVRRVGDHEQFSALRATEIGDGTPEARTVEDALHWMDLMTRSPDLFTQMCACIIQNNSIGLYNGSKNAVEIARKMARGEHY